MESFFKKVLTLDRRWIFALLLVVLFVPIACPLNLPGLKASGPVKMMYGAVDALPEGSTILVSFDFDPASKPELAPMGEALLRHAFRKKLKVVTMTLWVTGLGMETEIVDKIAAENKVPYGTGYVNLGWKPGQFAVVNGMGEDIYNMFPTGTKGNAIDNIEIMKGVRRLKDFALVVTLSAGRPGLDEWVAFGSDKYHFKLGGGATAVQEPPARVYLQSGQIVGLIGAMRGAAEYEFLIDTESDGTRGMDAISLGHYLIIGLILLGNIAYFFTRKAKEVAR